MLQYIICDTLRDLVVFVRLKKRENTHGKVLLSKTTQWVFSSFFKLYKWYQIAQSITFIKFPSHVPLKLP